jgi:iron complex outermembrane receptor protein
LRRGVITAGAVSFALALSATALSAPAPDVMGEVVVKGQIRSPRDSGFTETVFGTQEIRALGLSDVDDLLRRVPGMAVRDMQLGSVANAIVIRGFGNGGHGGDLGALIDGIPLNEAMSHADGYVDLNAVVPLEIASFTVLKGPVSALYGNYNRGGLINIQTRKGGEYAELDIAAGSHDSLDLQAAFGGRLGARQGVNLAGQVFRTDGYRPQSDTDRNILAGRWFMEVAPASQLALSIRHVKSTSRSASYLTPEQFQSDPQGIDPRIHNDGAEKDLLTLRADGSHRFSEALELLAFVYTTRQDFTRWFTRPVSTQDWRQREETYDRTVYGAGSSLQGALTIADRPMRYTAGLETFRESTRYAYYDGLDHRRRVNPALSDRETDLNSVSAFSEIEAAVHDLLNLSVGLRADRFTGACRLRGPETGSDPCSTLTERGHFSPKLAVRSQLRPWLQLRASWAEGFALANGFVKYAVGGQPLDENVFRQTEIGLRVTGIEGFELDVAAYRLTSTGEVRTVLPGVYENYGATLRRGIEANATWRPFTQLEVHATYALTDGRVQQNADARLVGRTVPGVPEVTGEVEARVRPFRNWSFHASWQYVGAYEADALNTVHAGGYGLFGAGLDYTRDGATDYRVYARVENMTDRRHATAVSVIGGQPLYAPGPPRSVRAGIQFTF